MLRPRLVLVSIYSQGGREWTFVEITPSLKDGKEVYSVPKGLHHELALRRSNKLGIKLPDYYTVTIGA